MAGSDRSLRKRAKEATDAALNMEQQPEENTESDRVLRKRKEKPVDAEDAKPAKPKKNTASGANKNGNDMPRPGFQKNLLKLGRRIVVQDDSDLEIAPPMLPLRRSRPLNFQIIQDDADLDIAPKTMPSRRNRPSNFQIAQNDADLEMAPKTMLSRKSRPSNFQSAAGESANLTGRQRKKTQIVVLPVKSRKGRSVLRRLTKVETAIQKGPKTTRFRQPSRKILEQRDQEEGAAVLIDPKKKKARKASDGKALEIRQEPMQTERSITKLDGARIIHIESDHSSSASDEEGWEDMVVKVLPMIHNRLIMHAEPYPIYEPRGVGTIDTASDMYLYGGPAVRVIWDRSIYDAMMCPRPVCTFCMGWPYENRGEMLEAANEAENMRIEPEESPTQGLPFLHTRRDCKRGDEGMYVFDPDYSGAMQTTKKDKGKGKVKAVQPKQEEEEALRALRDKAHYLIPKLERDPEVEVEFRHGEKRLVSTCMRCSVGECSVCQALRG